MTTIVRHDFTIHQGAIFAEPFAMVDDTLATKDYTGWSGTFTIYAAPATFDSLHDRTPLWTFTSASGAINLGLFDGGEFGPYSVYVYLTQAQTSAMTPWGRGVYNLDLIDTYGKPQVRLRGTIELEEGSTHG